MDWTEGSTKLKREINFLRNAKNVKQSLGGGTRSRSTKIPLTLVPTPSGCPQLRRNVRPSSPALPLLRPTAVNASTAVYAAARSPMGLRRYSRRRRRGPASSTRG
jgi:hypothetical protein